MKQLSKLYPEKQQFNRNETDLHYFFFSTLVSIVMKIPFNPEQIIFST